MRWTGVELRGHGGGRGSHLQDLPANGAGLAGHVAGALVAATTIAIVSVGYVAYLRLGAKFEQRYASGALASVVRLAVWLYAANIALLVGYRVARESRGRSGSRAMRRCRSF